MGIWREREEGGEREERGIHVQQVAKVLQQAS